MIKIIALDLDGTTLNSKGQLSATTKATLEEAIERGIKVVIATGRSFHSVPKDIFAIEGLEYIITSNGAHVSDLYLGENIYSNFIPPESLETIVDMVHKLGFGIDDELSLECFIDGHAYISEREFSKVKDHGSIYRDVDYILSTRTPVENIFDFMRANKSHLENINLNFQDLERRASVRKLLEEIPHIELTTSFKHNWEIEGEGTGKGPALKWLCDKLEIDSFEELLSCGDSPNDISMFKFAKYAVALANGTDETKEAANKLYPSNDEDGVAKAIRDLAFNS
ncbi:MAG: Cof-type HAD-IIB family hydrolase [Clostridia bacterium]|nr:Cof-type HAD-IIB family hydrolase [Clostridia bacterium]